MMKRLPGFLRRNFVYKLLSLIVAILLYVVVFGQQNPRNVEEVYVLPEVTGVPESLAVKIPPSAFTVNVSGQPALVKAFLAQPLKAIVDAAGAQAGRNALSITYQRPPGTASRLLVQGPTTVDVVLEKRERRRFAVTVLSEAMAPAGFQLDAPRAMPTQVTVTGLTEQVERVTEVVAEVSVPEEGGAIEQVVELVARDAKQRPVKEVRLEPNRVQVTQALKRTLARKNLVLSADITGQMPAGYALDAYQFSPSSVEVEGEPSVIESRSSLTLPIDISGLKATVARNLRITPPGGVRIVGNSVVRAVLTVRRMRVSAPVATSAPVVATPTPAPRTVEPPPEKP